MPRLAPLFALLLVVLTGCDALGIDSPEKLAALREAEGKAIGGACRHAARAIEDCYALNKKADKSAVFTGWREMNDYMRENKIEPVTPSLNTQLANAGPKAAEAAEEDAPPKAAVDKAHPATPKVTKATKAKAHDS
jgi:hypothetical protein